MIARRALPAEYVAWNARWQAPLGPSWRRRFWPGTRLAVPFARLFGPFAFQPNSTTRTVEYPWAFHAVPLVRGMDVIEVGGGLSGFQFVLARQGVNVTNVDPFATYGSGMRYRTDPARLHAGLGRALGAGVRLVRSSLDRAGLPAASVDRVYCISTLEHLSPGDIRATLAEVARILRPGGYFIVTVDLFLDLAPFTAQASNRWGTNVSVRALVDASGLRLVAGKPSELLGFPEFEPATILARRDDYFVGAYPVLAQLLALQR